MDIPAPVGWLTVTASMIVAGADTADAGDAPDATAAVASVVFTPSLARTWIFDTQQMLALDSVEATLDASGLLTLADGQPVHLVAPNQSSIADTAWSWTAKLTPGADQAWAGFSVPFTGAPGDTIVLGDPVHAADDGAGVRTRPVFVTDTQSTLRPAGAINGDLVYATGSGQLSRVSGV